MVATLSLDSQKARNKIFVNLKNYVDIYNTLHIRNFLFYTLRRWTYKGILSLAWMSIRPFNTTVVKLHIATDFDMKADTF